MTKSASLKLIMFILALSPLAAWALMPCNHNQFAKDIPDFVEKVRMYGKGPETRKELNLLAKELGLSPAEVKQLMQTVGALFCPADGTNEQAVGTAFLIGNSQEIVTAGHIVVGETGTKDLSKCFFENFEDPPQRQYLMVSHERNIIPKWLAKQDDDEDVARLTLARPLKNISKPLKIAKEELVAGKASVLLTAQNFDFKGTGKYPIAVPCPPMRVSEGRIYSCCNTDGGGSGGAHVGRDSDGDLVAQAVLVGGSAKVKNTRIPNKSECSESNRNLSLSLVGRGL